MCDFHDRDHLPPLDADEWALDTPDLRTFIAAVRVRFDAKESAAQTCAAIEPLFTSLIAERSWLPEEFQADAPHSGMGAGIGQWLLYRNADRSLCLFSLVVPPGASTPVHDHLAFGLIGLYRGNQDEEIYRQGDGALEIVRQRPLNPGDHYSLLPPKDDIHRVRTTSSVTSVSIHLLANDTGCVTRHTYDIETGEARKFRSGYVNAKCEQSP